MGKEVDVKVDWEVDDVGEDVPIFRMNKNKGEGGQAWVLPNPTCEMCMSAYKGFFVFQIHLKRKEN